MTSTANILDQAMVKPCRNDCNTLQTDLHTSTRACYTCYSHESQMLFLKYEFIKVYSSPRYTIYNGLQLELE